jgi:hypothetical protein
MDNAAATLGPRHRRASSWTSGSARDTSTVVSWLRLRAVPPSAERDSEGLWESEGTGPALDRGAAAAPSRDLRRPQPGFKITFAPVHSTAWLPQRDQDLARKRGDPLQCLELCDIAGGLGSAHRGRERSRLSSMANSVSTARSEGEPRTSDPLPTARDGMPARFM